MLTQWLRTNPRGLRVFLNIYPPLLGASIRVKSISKDFRHIRVEMPLNKTNKNYVGTHFGGSLYAMVDPFFMLMFMRILGPDYIVWDQSASIEFVNPGRGTVHTDFHVTEMDVENIKAHTKNGDVFRPTFVQRVYDEKDAIVAEISKTLYIRKKRGTL